jgi:RHS repeat-associated protein
VLRFDYDAAGQLVGTVDGLGTVTTYTYDALGNVVERRTATGTTTYAYDPVGFLVRATEAGCVLEIERDALGDVVRESVDGRAVTYARDSHGVQRRTPSGVDSMWTFDEDGNPATLSVGGHVVAFRHDQAGREIERTIGGGAVLAQAFDAEHQLIGQTVTARAGNRVVQQRHYQYRVDGQLTGVDDAISGPLRYRLDAAGRVIGVATRDGEESYRYDPSGNILHAQVPRAESDAGARGYAGNQLSAAGSVRYVHDRQGRLVARHEAGQAGARTWTYRWDAQDRLIAASTPDGAEWRYRYDPLGRRIAKQRWLPGAAAPAEETVFVWSGQLLVEQVQRGQDGQQLVLTWDHVPGSVRPVTQTEQLGAGVRFFSFLTDQVGTPVDMVDAHGVVAWHATASLWGRAKPGRTGVSTPLRFPGQYADDETGLHYNVFRYYDPGTGRYLSQDPLGLVPAPNPVVYVPNPLCDSDPLGLGGCMSKSNAAVGDDVTPPARAGGGSDAGHVQDTNPPSRPASPEAPLSNEPPPPRIPSSQWDPSHVPAGTKVYHSTDPANLPSLHGEDGGIRPAADPTAAPSTGAGANQWGGGELGNGFYTHKNPESAQNYTLHIDHPAVIEYTVKHDMDGKQSPGGWIGNMRGDDYRGGADFINGHHDPEEIKFHNGGDQLELNKISVYGEEFGSYSAYKEWATEMGLM